MNNKTTDRRSKIENFLSNLNTEIDILNLIDIDNINFDDPYQSICEMIEDNQGFDIEVIYYSNAIKYLKDNDPSLRDSLEIAEDLGFYPKDLNSEILASLLKSQNIREEFAELEEEINEFFNNLED